MVSYAQFYGPRLPEESLAHGMYDYRMNIAAQVRPNSTCSGSASGPGVTCAQTNLRNTVDPRHPYLYQRSFLSSAGPVTPMITDFPDTLGVSIPLSEAEQRTLNKGTSLQSYQTRLTPTPDVMETPAYANRALSVGTAWRETFKLMPTPESSLSTRIQENNIAYARQNATRNQFGSYGSYGVIRV